eukprot:COSAG01_NODE_1772_length_9263_cov_93.070930_1_plen_44_part_00
MGGMTIATWTNEDLTEKEDEHVCVEGEGGRKIRKDTEQESSSF